MTLHPLVGHHALRSSLARACRRGSLPAIVLIHGSRGVGKQHLALWLGQLLLCRGPAPNEPCSACKACRLASSLEHPDLHWYFPLPLPKGVRPDKLRVTLENARHEALRERRRNPLRPAVPDGAPTGLYLAAAQHLRLEALKRPAMGARQVFVVGEAESLVPQESSPHAANALLKLLEEPPAGTFLVLTSSEPARVLDTIRSRAMRLHLPGLPDEDVTRFLVEAAGVDLESARRAGLRGRGSIGRALGFLPDGEKAGPLEERRQLAFRLLEAATASDSGAVYREALAFQPARARGLMPLLDLLEDALRDLSATAADAPERVISRDRAEFLERIRAHWDIHPVAVAAALETIQEAKELAAGNVNPQLLVAGTLTGIREALNGTI